MVYNHCCKFVNLLSQGNPQSQPLTPEMMTHLFAGGQPGWPPRSVVLEHSVRQQQHSTRGVHWRWSRRLWDGPFDAGLRVGGQQWPQEQSEDHLVLHLEEGPLWSHSPPQRQAWGQNASIQASQKWNVVNISNSSNSKLAICNALAELRPSLHIVCSNTVFF